MVTESVFARGVCLMMHHDQDGAIGVMLNRPIWPPPAELMKMIIGGPEPEDSDPLPGVEVKKWSGKSRLKLGDVAAVGVDGEPPTPQSPSGFVHFGGPLSGPVLAIHESKALAEAQTGAGIYVAAQKEHLEQLVREKTSDYRLIIGHAGWSSGQLDREIEEGRWHVLPATAEMVFGTETDLWPLLLRRATGSSLARWVGAPDNAEVLELN